MPEPGLYRTPPLQAWQRTNVVAVANCLRELIPWSPDDSKLLAAYEGLLELLDPSRKLARRQRELAGATRQAATAVKNERRQTDRRRTDRRQALIGAPGGVERRGRDRRHAKDRRR